MSLALGVPLHALGSLQCTQTSLLADAESPASNAMNNNSLVYFEHIELDSMNMCPLDDDNSTYTWKFALCSNVIAS